MGNMGSTHKFHFNLLLNYSSSCKGRHCLIYQEGVKEGYIYIIRVLHTCMAFWIKSNRSESLQHKTACTGVGGKYILFSQVKKKILRHIYYYISYIALIVVREAQDSVIIFKSNKFYVKLEYNNKNIQADIFISSS